MAFPAISWGSEVGYLFGCAGKSCIDLVNGSSVGGGGGGQPKVGSASGGMQHFNIKATEEDDNLTYSDGQDDAWAGRPRRAFGGEYAAGYEDEEDFKESTIINGE